MNSLERKLKLAVLLIVSVVFFTFACKGNGNKPESESKDPKLELVSIFVSGVRVENGRVTVSDEELRYKDVTAIFNYGKIKNKARLMMNLLWLIKHLKKHCILALKQSQVSIKAGVQM